MNVTHVRKDGTRLKSMKGVVIPKDLSLKIIELQLKGRNRKEVAQ